MDKREKIPTSNLKEIIKYHENVLYNDVWNATFIIKKQAIFQIGPVVFLDWFLKIERSDI